jgi:hypothetical protein
MMRVMRWIFLIFTIIMIALIIVAATHPFGTRFALGIWPVPQGTPWTYQLESGFIPALTVLTLLGAVTSMWHVHNCHHDGCWRLGKHRINGTPWCNKHQHLVRPERSERELLEEICAHLTVICNKPDREL